MDTLFQIERKEKKSFLCNNDKPLSLTVKFNGRSTTANITETEGSYNFEIPASPKLSKALEINNKRTVLANKEYQKRRK